jgi:hypothetical protein
MQIRIEGTNQVLTIRHGNFGTTILEAANGDKTATINMDKPTALAVAKAIEETSKQK